MLSVILRRGLMFVLSSPSGAGKSTISRALLREEKDISMSVSVTTRPPRPGEIDGRDYFFAEKIDFNIMVNRQEFLEHAKVFGHYYGTPKVAVEQQLASGKDVLFDIDWQGTQQLAQQARDDLVSIFILPPSTKELERRLEKRAQDPQEVVLGRMNEAAGEISHWAEYDYVIINDRIEKCIEEVKIILAAERLKRERQTGLLAFVKLLREGQ